MGVGTNGVAQTLETRWQSEVHVRGYENSTFLDKLRGRSSFFGRWVWGHMFLPKLWTHDGKVRSMSWAKKI